MSNEDRMPHEFIDIEARLSALAPAPSRVDRDALLYRAGFAAAKAQAAKRRWIPPVTTAAAVLVAVVVTHALSTTSATVIPDAGDKVAYRSAKTADEQASPAQRAPRPQYRFNLKTAPLLAARERALQMDFEELPELASGVSVPSGPAATFRRLQEEYMPRRSGTDAEPSPSRWLQPWIRNGEST